MISIDILKNDGTRLQFREDKERFSLTKFAGVYVVKTSTEVLTIAADTVKKVEYLGGMK